MSATPIDPKPHEHQAVTTIVLQQAEGVPYQIERTVCDACRQLLAERRLRRAAA